MDKPVKISGKDRRFSLLHRVRNSPGAHPASYLKGIGGSLSRGKMAEA
jgi:hypothetical protein